MPEGTAKDGVVEQIATTDPEAFEITTSGASVTGKRLFADGGDGQEKEANVTDPVAGASSAAPAGSGIPSAMRQQAIHAGLEEMDEQDRTPMADRDIPVRQDVNP